MHRLKLTIFFATLISLTLAPSSYATFKSASSPIKILAKATQTQVFTSSNTEVKCSDSMAFSTGQTKSTASSQAKLTANYTGCQIKPSGGGEITATVSMESCSYNFHSGTTEPSKGAVSLECPGGRAVKLAFSGCEMEFKASDNLNLKAIEFSNSGGRVIISPSVTGITWRVVAGFFNEFHCESFGIVNNAEGKAGKEGTYKGTAEAEAKTSSGTGVNIEVA